HALVNHHHTRASADRPTCTLFQVGKCRRCHEEKGIAKLFHASLKTVRGGARPIVADSFAPSSKRSVAVLCTNDEGAFSDIWKYEHSLGLGAESPRSLIVSVELIQRDADTLINFRRAGSERHGLCIDRNNYCDYEPNLRHRDSDKTFHCAD